MEVIRYDFNFPPLKEASIDLYNWKERVIVKLPNIDHFVNILEYLSDKNLWLDKETIEKISSEYWDQYKN